MTKRTEALNLIQQAEKIVFLTGAGVSVPSGIPDYRSLNGLYQGLNQPEYLLSHSCLKNEPAVFYNFVKKLYHVDAQPNKIHQKMSQLEQIKPSVTIVTQNIDQLHQVAGSQKVVNFHGNLYDCYCSACLQQVSAANYLENDRHLNCGGQVRPNVVLYEEGLEQQVINQALESLAEAELIVIVGTSLKVQPFSSLVDYRGRNSQVIVINQEKIAVATPHMMIVEDALSFFADL